MASKEFRVAPKINIPGAVSGKFWKCTSSSGDGAWDDAPSGGSGVPGDHVIESGSGTDETVSSTSYSDISFGTSGTFQVTLANVGTWFVIAHMQVYCIGGSSENPTFRMHSIMTDISLYGASVDTPAVWSSNGVTGVTLTYKAVTTATNRVVKAQGKVTAFTTALKVLSTGSNIIAIRLI